MSTPNQESCPICGERDTVSEERDSKGRPMVEFYCGAVIEYDPRTREVGLTDRCDIYGGDLYRD